MYKLKYEYDKKKSNNINTNILYSNYKLLPQYHPLNKKKDYLKIQDKFQSNQW